MEPTGNTGTLDYESAADRIGASIFPSSIETPETPEPEPPKAEAPTATPEPPPAAPKTYDVPKSWKKEMHEHWGTMRPEAQAYVL